MALRAKDLMDTICRRCRYYSECTYDYGCPAFRALKAILNPVMRVHNMSEEILERLELT